jgi:hypothetical protein
MRLDERLRPRPTERQQLCAVHEALPLVDNDFRLRLTPAGQSVRPLSRPPHVGHVMASLDDGEVQVPDDRRRNLSGRDDRHRFVQQGHPLTNSTPPDQVATLAHPSQCNQFRIAEAIAGRGGSSETRCGAVDITFDHPPQ